MMLLKKIIARDSWNCKREMITSSRRKAEAFIAEAKKDGFGYITVKNANFNDYLVVIGNIVDIMWQFIVTILVPAIIVIGMVWGIVALVNSRQPGMYDWDIETYSVSSGDTCWGIAREIGVSEEDIPAWVDMVEKLNSQNPDQLQPGDEIRIPVPPKKEK